MSLGLSTLAKQINHLIATQKTQSTVNFELVDEYEFKLYDDFGNVVKHYKPEKTALKFHADDSPVRAVKGPVGSGKSSFCIADIYLRAVRMPKCVDGVRRQRTLFVRNTYKDLMTSTFRTWKAWYGKFGDIYERSAPWIYKRHTFNDKDGQIVLEIDGFSCDRPDQFEDFSSVEFTTAYLNEARGLPAGILTRIQERLGRFPEVVDCPYPFWIGLIADTNAPNLQHWFYDLFEKKRPKGFVLYNQPSGLIEDKKADLGYRTNPEAENLENLPKDYYLKLVPGKSREEIRVQLMGEYGTLLAGKAVYHEYNDAYHFVEKTFVLHGSPILMGWDYGLTPACVIAQITATGRFIVHQEITAPTQMGIERFSETIVLPILNTRYPQWRQSFVSRGDPAGNQRAQTDEKTCEEILLSKGILTRGAQTNAFMRRREAVAYYLTRFADGMPAFVISGECPILRSGFLGAYHYKEIQIGNEQSYKEEPEKNAASHPHDALQYIALEYFTQNLYGDSANYDQYNMARTIS